MLFLLRFMAMKAAVSSPFFILKPMDLRLCSPVSGGSTLVTSAPMSARTWQQNGPAITCVRSRTFSFSSGNIETRSLHLAVAYAFDRGSLLLPRGHPPPAQGAYASYQVIVKEHSIVKEHRGRTPSRNRRLKQHSYFIGRGSVGERPSTSTPALGTAGRDPCPEADAGVCRNGDRTLCGLLVGGGENPGGSDAQARRTWPSRTTSAARVRFGYKQRGCRADSLRTRTCGFWAEIPGEHRGPRWRGDLLLRLRGAEERVPTCDSKG